MPSLPIQGGGGLRPGKNVTEGESKGFTLVELLVVIGIIALMLSVLLPALASARRMAGQAQCASNLRQWAVAVNEYAQQNGGFLPRRGQGIMPTSQLGNYDDWFNELPPFLAQPTYQTLTNNGTMPRIGDHSIWICPQLNGMPNQNGYLFGYAMNMALSTRDAPLPDRIDKIGSAATMVFMCDGPAGYCSAVPFATTPGTPAAYCPVARHNGRANIAFLDGHVSAYDATYLGIGTQGTPANPDGCDQPDVRWYWYVPGPGPAPWPGP